MADSILSNSTLKFAATLSVPIVYDENTDALEAYNNRPEVSTYTGSDLLSQATAYINEAQLNDFIAYIDGLDLDALTDEIITEAKSKYAQLSADSKGAIPEKTYSKFVQIVTPIKDTNDFSDEIAAFRPTDFVRPTNSKVAWTEGGIQSFVDKLGGLVGGFVNINDILSQNLYTADIVNMIYDLYATLSHNTTDIEGLITLGEIISGVITPEYLTSSLPESKFSAVVEKSTRRKLQKVIRKAQIFWIRLRQSTLQQKIGASHPAIKTDLLTRFLQRSARLHSCWIPKHRFRLRL